MTPPHTPVGMVLRWSWRDLRQRWLLVAAIALIIALGTGTFAGLGSTAEWRRASNDASFGALAMHDLRLTLAQGAVVDAGALADIARAIPSAERIAGVEERLVGRTEVDASTPDETVLVPGEVVGVDVTEPLEVDRVHVADGRPLEAADDGQPVTILEQQFANVYDLPAQGSLRVSGDEVLDYVGVGTAPEHFIVTGRTGGLFAQGGTAVLFMPLTTAQSLLGFSGSVNELVLTVEPGTNVAELERDLSDALTAAFPETGATFTQRADEPAYRMLYEDIENDQQFWNIIAGLILLGATFAAFNLTTRMVDAQRREIGVGMALGLSPRRLSFRPLLVGFQIAALGVVLGIGVGFLLDVWLKDVFEQFLPLPEWRTPFQAGVFARAAAIGFVLPFFATAIPVWRAVRVQPVDAIRVGHLAAKTSGLAPLLARIPLRGRTYRQIPFRNLMRTPRRTALTSLAIGASIASLVAVIGTVDSFFETLDRGESELTHEAPNRLVAELDTFVAESDPVVLAVAGLPEVETATPALRVFGTVSTGHDEFDVLTDLVDFESAPWRPTITSGSVETVRAGGIVLSEKAARDLGVDVGDTVTFRHPEREGTSYRMIDSEVPVSATHAGPLRALAYFDASQAGLFNLTGIVNGLTILPREGVTADAAKRAVFAVDGVSSVESITATTDLLRDTIDQFLGVLRVAEFIVLLLAVLIAFNATSIGIDERRREHATMLAYGLKPRVVLTMATVESVVTGILGTVVGVLAGFGIVRWMMRVQLDDTMPDLDVPGSVSVTTLVTAAVVGIVAVGIAPLFTARRIRRMDIPSTLRVIE